MAFFNPTSNGSYLFNQQPQQNQYLTANPATQPNANLDWMAPEQKSNTTGIVGGGGVQNIPQAQSNPSQVQNGTMLGSIAAGNSYQPTMQNAPLGFDQTKWADPNQGNSLKYQVGRMAAAGMPIDQIAKSVGAKVIGPDKIQYPDGFIADIYFDYGGPNQRVQYTNVTPQGQYNSMLGQGNNQNQQQQDPGFLRQMMQQIFTAMQQQKQNRFHQGYQPSNTTSGQPATPLQSLIQGNQQGQDMSWMFNPGQPFGAK